MKRAVAFCQVIEQQKGGKHHKVSSKHEKFETIKAIQIPCRTSNNRSAFASFAN